MGRRAITGSVEKKPGRGHKLQKISSSRNSKNSVRPKDNTNVKTKKTPLKNAKQQAIAGAIDSKEVQSQIKKQNKAVVNNGTVKSMQVKGSRKDLETSTSSIRNARSCSSKSNTKSRKVAVNEKLKAKLPKGRKSENRTSEKKINSSPNRSLSRAQKTVAKTEIIKRSRDPSRLAGTTAAGDKTHRNRSRREEKLKSYVADQDGSNSEVRKSSVKNRRLSTSSKKNSNQPNSTRKVKSVETKTEPVSETKIMKRPRIEVKDTERPSPENITKEQGKGRRRINNIGAKASGNQLKRKRKSQTGDDALVTPATAVELETEADKTSPIRTTKGRKCRSNFEKVEAKLVNEKITEANKVKRAYKRKQVGEGHGIVVDALTDIIETASEHKNKGDVSNKQPVTKKRKKSESAERIENNSSKQVRKSRKDVEDPYDFEAYLSTITPGKRNKKCEIRTVEKTTALPSIRRLPQRTAWGGVARKSKTPAHKFFIQPSKPKKKSNLPDHVEEPSPSVAEEIVEFTLQPPLVPDDNFIDSCKPFGVPSSSMIISTPCTNLSAAPLLRSTGGTIISPITAASEDSVNSSVDAPVKPTKSSSPNKRVERTEGEAVERIQSGELVNSQLFSSAGNKKESATKRKAAEKSKVEKEKDEFELWLENFSRELSDIESFQLTVESFDQE